MRRFSVLQWKWHLNISYFKTEKCNWLLKMISSIISLYFGMWVYFSAFKRSNMYQLFNIQTRQSESADLVSCHVKSSSSAWPKYRSMIIRTCYSPWPFCSLGVFFTPSWSHIHTRLILWNRIFVLASQLHAAFFSTTCFPVIHLFSLLLFALTAYFLCLSIFTLLWFPLLWHQGQPWPIQAPGLKQISVGLYSPTRIKNS